MHVATKVAPQREGLNLSPIPALPTADTSITVRVTLVVGDTVLVSCGEKRAGVFDLTDARNQELRSRAIKEGYEIKAFILKEDTRTGNLLLMVKPPDPGDRWRQLYPIGVQVEGVVTEKTEEYIQVAFPRSTKGRIKKIDLPPGKEFDQLAGELRVGQPVMCKVLGVFSRRAKNLRLTFD